MATFRENIKAYVDEHWMVPCKDGIVWVYYAGINTTAKAAEHKKKTGKDWAAAFLQYPDPTFGSMEGLYLIPAGELGKVKGGQFDATKYPERKMLASWFDKADKDAANPEVIAQKPADHGLNDCAHFVTESLAAGGIHVETTGVGTLYNSLRGMADTKTLAKMVSAAAADNVIKSGVMKAGDVIIYSKEGKHAHSVVYMGGGQIAMHTWANHPKHPTIKGDWKKSATADHPQVTLIHFGRDDATISPTDKMLGWWRVQWRGTDYFYLFETGGRVGWTKQAPASLKQSLTSAGGRGYWFNEPLRVGICWTDSGSFEALSVRPPKPDTHMEGTWNGVDPLVADKL